MGESASFKVYIVKIRPRVFAVGDDKKQDAVLSQVVPRDAAVNFGTFSKFSAASGGFHCDNNAFELNSSINHGKIRVFNI